MTEPLLNNLRMFTRRQERSGVRLRDEALKRVTDEAALQIRRELTGTLGKAMNAAIRTCASEILEMLRDPFGRAVAALELSVQTLGPSPNKDAVLAAGPATMASWEGRKQASKLLESVRSVRLALASAHWGPRDQGAAWYVASVRDLDELAAANRVLSRGIVALVEAGHQMRLNDLEEIEAVTSGALAVTTEEETARREEAKAVAARANRREVEGWEKAIKQATNVQS